MHKGTGKMGARIRPHLQLNIALKAEVLSIPGASWLHPKQGSVLHGMWGAHGKPNGDGAALPLGPWHPVLLAQPPSVSKVLQVRWDVRQHEEKEMQKSSNTSSATLCFRAHAGRWEHWRGLPDPSLS